MLFWLWATKKGRLRVCARNKPPWAAVREFWKRARTPPVVEKKGSPEVNLPQPAKWVDTKSEIR